MNTKPLRVAVTGYQGKVGVHIVDALLEAGHEIVGIDKNPPNRDDILGDTTDHAFDVVVQLAAIPHPRMFSNSVTLTNNVAVAYNVFEACRRLGLRDIVLASSETVHGVPFGQSLDDLPYLPLDEDSPRRGRNAYGLSKMLTEHIAEEYAKNDPELRVTSLRPSYVQEVEEYAEYEEFADDPEARVWDLWAYIDARDVAQSVIAALTYEPRGFEPFLIAANDTVMPIPTAELVVQRFPDVPIKGELGPDTSLMSNRRAEEKLGFKPKHSWRHHVTVKQ